MRFRISGYGFWVERERERVCVCVCEREREREREGANRWRRAICAGLSVALLF